MRRKVRCDWNSFLAVVKTIKWKSQWCSFRFWQAVYVTFLCCGALELFPIAMEVDAFLRHGMHFFAWQWSLAMFANAFVGGNLMVSEFQPECWFPVLRMRGDECKFAWWLLRQTLAVSFACSHISDWQLEARERGERLFAIGILLWPFWKFTKWNSRSMVVYELAVHQTWHSAVVFIIVLYWYAVGFVHTGRIWWVLETVIFADNIFSKESFFSQLNSMGSN